MAGKKGMSMKMAVFILSVIVWGTWSIESNEPVKSVTFGRK